MEDIVKKHGITLGSDPELFLIKTKNGNMKAWPAIGLIGGSKDKPLHIDESGYRTLQEDNVALEYTTHPVNTSSDWVKEQTMMFKLAVATAAKFECEVEYNQASMTFNREVLRSKAAMTFGCEPTWNAFTNKENPEPMSLDKSMRSIGGHIHIGYKNPTLKKSLELAKILDVLYLKIQPKNHSESMRRTLYGKLGEIRLKSYGFEWRTPSAEWVGTNLKQLKMWDLVMRAFTLYDEGMRFTENKDVEIERLFNNSAPLRSSMLPEDLFLKKLITKRKKK